MLENINNNRILYTEEDKKAIINYLNSNRPLSEYGRDGVILELEEMIKRYFNMNFALTTNSGTNALLLAFLALGINEGDEVIVPTNTFFATVIPLFLLKAIPILTDCEYETGNISFEEIKKNITKKTKAIVVTHINGYPADMNNIYEFARINNLFIVEDISLSVGSQIDNRKVGTFSDIACFSLGSTKLLSGGQGGAIITNNQYFYYRASLFGHFGKRLHTEILDPFYRSFTDSGYGMNCRLHVLSAVVILNKFKNIDALIMQRHERYNLLRNYLLKTNIFKPVIEKKNIFLGMWHGLHVKVLETINKSNLINLLNNEKIEVSAHPSYRLLHTTKFFQTYTDGLFGVNTPNKNKKLYKKGDFPIAEKFFEHTIYFPLFLDESMDVIHYYGKKCMEIESRIKD